MIAARSVVVYEDLESSDSKSVEVFTTNGMRCECDEPGYMDKAGMKKDEREGSTVVKSSEYGAVLFERQKAMAACCR